MIHTRNRLGLFGLVFLVATFGQSQTTQTVSGPTESKHLAGPVGLDGWTLNYVVPGDTESYPEILVIARNGRTLREIKGHPFIWKWKFLNDGRQVAYETGPRHFALVCILLDLASGKQLATYDCYHMPLPNPPSWVNELEKP